MSVLRNAVNFMLNPKTNLYIVGFLMALNLVGEKPVQANSSTDAATIPSHGEILNRDILTNIQKSPLVNTPVNTSITAPTPVNFPANPVITTPANPPTSIFTTAERELPSEFYALYRIVERISRANGYDNSTWQVAITPRYSRNAFASGINLIAVPQGILQQVAGDSSALACIVAHEMGHQVKQHIPIDAKQKNEYINQIRAQIERENSNRPRGNNIINSTARVVGGVLLNRVLPGIAGDVVGGIISSRNNSENTLRRIEETIEKRTQELTKHLNKTNRNQELEADEIAYIASVRAGFEPEGCVRALRVMERFADMGKSSDWQPEQPTINQRLAALKTVMEKNLAPILTQEGRNLITRSQPLTYNFANNFTNNTKSLRINPRHGGSPVQDINRLFGE